MRVVNSFKGNYLIILLLVSLLSSNVSASVVSDNDGSAFITKSEFDSLKNNFQTEINQYNTSIDSKIDLAISQYLAGIKADKKLNLVNIYDSLGGNNIKFGFPDIAPTATPSTGIALFFENGDKFGVGILVGPGGSSARYGIMDPNHSFWNNYNDSHFKLGQFIKYVDYDGKKFLDRYVKGAIQAVWSGGWWTGNTSTSKDSTVRAPFGNGAQKLNVPISVVSYYNCDFYNGVYRDRKDIDLDLSLWTSAYDISTGGNKVFISTTNYENVDKFQETWPNMTATGPFYNGTTTSDGTIHDTGDCTLLDLNIYNWTIDTAQKYESLTPGFYNRKQYSNSLYGGVQFFKATKTGKVKIEALKFTRSSSGTVYFAIKSSSFDNQEALKGDVKFDKIEGCAVSSSSDNRYSATAGDTVKLEFDVVEGKTYYIKCQPSTTKNASNTLYCGMANGATIELTYE